METGNRKLDTALSFEFPVSSFEFPRPQRAGVMRVFGSGHGERHLAKTLPGASGAARSLASLRGCAIPSRRQASVRYSEQFLCRCLMDYLPRDKQAGSAFSAPKGKITQPWPEGTRDRSWECGTSCPEGPGRLHVKVSTRASFRVADDTGVGSFVNAAAFLAVYPASAVPAQTSSKWT